MTSNRLSTFATRLTSHGIVRVSGPDALRFLQGLVTNDVHQICGPHAPSTQAAAFLNGRGRVLFGVLMHLQDENDYLIDVDKSRIPQLLKHLRQYRLRAKVDVDQSDLAVWSLVGGSNNSTPHGTIFEDPRLPELGHRAIVDENFVSELPTADESSFTTLRILHGVPDGSDFEDTPLPLDLALHLLHGVSFSKGCYLGQELTARSHFTGVLRKRITPLMVTSDGPISGAKDAESRLSTAQEDSLAIGAELFVEGKAKPAGRVSSCVHNVGLATLRLADVSGEGRLQLEDGRAVAAWQPPWWRARSADAVPASS